MMSAVLSLCLCWTLSLCLLVSAAEVNKTAAPGQTVSLPCRAPSNTHIIVVEWTRPGLGSEYVFLYRDGKPVPHNQHQAFKNRVELEDTQMKDGDVSILLRNVTRDDSGTYECRVVLGNTKHRKRANLPTEPIITIHLEVQSGRTEKTGDKEGGDKDGGDKKGGEKNHPAGLAVGLPVGLLLVVAVAGGFFYRRTCSSESQLQTVNGG